MRRATFEQAWAVADRVPGWLTREQAQVLWDRASSLPPGGVCVEVGSHQGRSTLVLGHAAAARDATVIAVDPFVNGRLFGGARTRELFSRHVADAGLDGAVTLEADYSRRVRSRWRTPVHLLYVDGKHDYWSCTDDLRWTRFMREGDAVVVHDAFSSVGVTAALLAAALRRDRLVYRGRTGSLAEYAVGVPTAADRRRVLRELPWFTRNVVIKVLLRLRLRPVAGVLGHRSPYDPY